MTFQHLHEYLFFLVFAFSVVEVTMMAGAISYKGTLLHHVMLQAGAAALVTNSIIIGVGNALVFYMLSIFFNLHAISGRFVIISMVVIQLAWAWIAWSTVNG